MAEQTGADARPRDGAKAQSRSAGSLRGATQGRRPLPPLTLGRQIRLRRGAAGVTLEALAGALGVAPAQVRALEADEELPEAELMQMLMERLGLDDGDRRRFRQLYRQAVDDGTLDESQGPFGQLVQVRRMRLGLDRGEVAEEAGLPEQVLTECESGLQHPSPAAARALAQGLRLTGEELEAFWATFALDCRDGGPPSQQRPGPLVAALRGHRFRCDLTRKELARRAGCSVDAIVKTEHGVLRPSGEQLEALIAAFGLDAAAARRLRDLHARSGGQAHGRTSSTPARPVAG